MSMGSDLLLLAVEHKSGEVRSRRKLGVALAAADLVDLVLAGRVALDGDRLTVVGHREVPDVPVDAVLRVLITSAQPVTIAFSLSDRATTAFGAHLREAKHAQLLAEARRTKNEKYTPLAVLDQDRATAAARRFTTVARAATQPAADDAGALADLAYVLLADAVGFTPAYLSGPFNRKARTWLAAQASQRSDERQPERSVRAIVRTARRIIEHTKDRPGDGPVPMGESHFNASGDLAGY